MRISYWQPRPPGDGDRRPYLEAPPPRDYCRPDDQPQTDEEEADAPRVIIIDM